MSLSFAVWSGVVHQPIASWETTANHCHTCCPSPAAWFSLFSALVAGSRVNLPRMQERQDLPSLAAGTPEDFLGLRARRRAQAPLLQRYSQSIWAKVC